MTSVSADGERSRSSSATNCPEADNSSRAAAAFWTSSRLRVTASFTAPGPSAVHACRRMSAGEPCDIDTSERSIASSKRLWRRLGCGSTTAPPPSVSPGEGRRRIYRSPRTATTGWRNSSCSQPSCPGSSTSVPSRRTAAMVSDVARNSLTSLAWRSGAEASGSRRKRTSSIRLG